MIEFDLDISSLTEEGIQMGANVFSNVKELVCSSMIDWLLMIEMLIPLINSLDRRVDTCERRGVLKCLLIIKTGKHYAT